MIPLKNISLALVFATSIAVIGQVTYHLVARASNGVRSPFEIIAVAI